MVLLLIESCPVDVMRTCQVRKKKYSKKIYEKKKAQRETSERAMLIGSTKTLADEGGFGSEAYHEKVGIAYRVAKKETELLFGVDRELTSGKEDKKRPRRRADGSPISGLDALRQIEEKRYAGRQQETWSLGYGEITSGSFDSLLHYMIYDAPEQLRLREGMSFLDIGSGKEKKRVTHKQCLSVELFVCFVFDS